ncbi:hypothetical protein [Massilia sp. TN1-12]|uniref:hypothetical protein n=1 Tax=Massilia paldalensis TaxID=3377675 RepID=UPI00384F3667
MATINASSAYRVQGTVMNVSEMAKQKPGFVMAATAEQVQELARHDQQMQQRAAAQQAQQQTSKIFGQVIVNGEVIATVYDSGSAQTQQDIAGLKLSEEGEGLTLAQTRLDEITRAVKGQVIYSNFVPPKGPRTGSGAGNGPAQGDGTQSQPNGAGNGLGADALAHDQ